MSTNIDNWKTKKLEDFKIPMWVFKGPECRIKLMPEKDNSVLISIMEGTIEGKMLSIELMRVDKINYFGEGSGSNFGNILLPALEKSTGVLEATLIWEGGEIEKLFVNNGKVKRENLDI